MIDWIFFDIGSTLVDETESEKYRFEKTIEGSDFSLSKFKEEYINLYKENKDAYHIMVKKYNLNYIPWPSFLDKPIENVKKILEYLKLYFHLGIIANQPLGTEQRLKEMGIHTYFEVIMSSAEEKLEKPDPRFFLKALEKANVKAEHAIMIGDRLDNDILPSMNLGFKTIWLRKSYGAFGNPSLLPKKIDLIIDDLRDLLSISIEELKNL